MPRRTFWLTAGIAVGAGSSLWVERRVRRAIDDAAARLRPDALAMELGRSARGAAEVAAARLQQAVATGRDQMRRTEQDLWTRLVTDGRVVEERVTDGRVVEERVTDGRVVEERVTVGRPRRVVPPVPVP